MGKDNSNNIFDQDEFDAIFSSVFGDDGLISEDGPSGSASELNAAEEYTGDYADVSVDGLAGDGSPEEYPYSPADEAQDEPVDYYPPEREGDEDFDAGSDEGIEFDPRFRLGRRKPGGYSFGGKDVSCEEDEGYTRPVASEQGGFTSSYAENEYSDDYGFEEYPDGMPETPKKGISGLFSRSRRKKADKDSVGEEKEEQYDNQNRERKSPEEDIEEFNDEDYDYEPDADLSDEFIPDSFREYLSSRLTGAFIKIRGGMPAEKVPEMTADDYEEDLGPELPPLSASKYYGSYIHSLSLRFRISLVILVLEAYIAFGLPLPGMLKSLQVSAAASMGLQFAIMILSLDVFTTGLVNIFHGIFGADALAAVSCLLTSADAIMVSYSNVPLHMPLCAVSSLSLVGVLFSSTLSAKALRKTLRVPGIGKYAFSVTAETGVVDKESTILKSSLPTDGFVRRTEETPVDEDYFRKASPFLAAGALFFALIVTAVKKSPESFVAVLSAVFAPAVPFTALLSFALPFFIGSHKLFHDGVAIAGWSGTLDVGKCTNVIVTDSDLFPERCLEIESVRIFADYDSSKVISYAGSLIISSGTSLSEEFKKLMEENGCELLNVENYSILAGGGLKGMIEGHSVICGNSDLMRLMNIRIPYRLVSDTSVLLSIDGILYGIFNIHYSADPSVRRALVSLMRSSRHPVFATRDFNITPELIHDAFDVATDGYDFPPYPERFTLSETGPSRGSKISGVICREGLGPLIAMADYGRKISSTAKAGTVISLIGAAVGILFVFFSLIITERITASAVLIFMLIEAVPVLLLGLSAVSAG